MNPLPLFASLLVLPAVCAAEAAPAARKPSCPLLKAWRQWLAGKPAADSSGRLSVTERERAQAGTRYANG